MAGGPVDRKLAAILAPMWSATVASWARDEAGTPARLKTLRKEFIAPKIAEHRGRVVKLTGDGALVEFASVVNAVQCAADTQVGIGQRHASLPPEQRIDP
jgi:adenylate cyclase